MKIPSENVAKTIGDMQRKHWRKYNENYPPKFSENYGRNAAQTTREQVAKVTSENQNYTGENAMESNRKMQRKLPKEMRRNITGKKTCRLQ